MNQWVVIVGGAWLAMGVLHWWRIARWYVRTGRWQRVNWVGFVALLPLYLLEGPIGLAVQEFVMSDKFDWWKLTDEELAERGQTRTRPSDEVRGWREENEP